VALAAGASDDQVESIARQLVQEHHIHVDRAREILEAMD